MDKYKLISDYTEGMTDAGLESMMAKITSDEEWAVYKEFTDRNNELDASEQEDGIKFIIENIPTLADKMANGQKKWMLEQVDALANIYIYSTDWKQEDVEKLCKLADMEDEYRNADETKGYENLVSKALDKMTKLVEEGFFDESIIRTAKGS